MRQQVEPEDGPLLTGGAFAPISDHVALLRDEPAAVCEAIRARWQERSYPQSHNLVQERTGDLRAALGALLPCRVPIENRYVVMSTTRPEWTAVFCNAGTGDVGGAGSLAGLDRWTFDAFVRRGAIEYYVSLHKVAWSHPPSEGRRVRVFLGDRRVELQDIGEPWPFEQPYPRRLRRDSVPADLMRRYVEDLGFGWVWDEDQYAPDGRFWLVSTSFTNEHLTERPLEQVQAEYLAALASGHGLR